MNRRSFLTALAAPLILKPTLEDIERLTWKRRLFPGVGPGIITKLPFWTHASINGIAVPHTVALSGNDYQIRFDPPIRAEQGDWITVTYGFETEWFGLSGESNTLKGPILDARLLRSRLSV